MHQLWLGQPIIISRCIFRAHDKIPGALPHYTSHRSVNRSRLRSITRREGPGACAMWPKQCVLTYRHLSTVIIGYLWRVILLRLGLPLQKAARRRAINRDILGHQFSRQPNSNSTNGRQQKKACQPACHFLIAVLRWDHKQQTLIRLIENQNKMSEMDAGDKNLSAIEQGPFFWQGGRRRGYGCWPGWGSRGWKIENDAGWGIMYYSWSVQGRGQRQRGVTSKCPAWRSTVRFWVWNILSK